MRSEMINGMFPLWGPPNVWVTLNPLEANSQIVLHIAGVRDISFDLSNEEGYPSYTERLKTSS